MANNTPIDEYAFWKSLILEMEDKGEEVQDKIFQLMDLAEKKTLDYLLDKFDLKVTDKRKKLTLH